MPPCEREKRLEERRSLHRTLLDTGRYRSPRTGHISRAINQMEDYPGSGLSISQLLQALNKAVDVSMAEARRYSRRRPNPRSVLTCSPVQDDPQYERGLPLIPHLILAKTDGPPRSNLARRRS